MLRSFDNDFDVISDLKGIIATNHQMLDLDYTRLSWSEYKAIKLKKDQNAWCVGLYFIHLEIYAMVLFVHFHN